MWSIAVAAIHEDPLRELLFVIGTRDIQSLYMLGALRRLARFPNIAIIQVVSKPQDLSRTIRFGSPFDYMPRLSSRDIVYTAGSPAMTERVGEIARDAGARCYKDAFVAAPEAGERRNPVAAWLAKGTSRLPSRASISARLG